MAGAIWQEMRDAVIGALRQVGGYLALPTAPGLGVELDMAVITEHPYTPFKFDLFEEGWERRFDR